MKLSCIKTIVMTVSYVVLVSSLLQISNIQDVYAAPGGMGGGMGPVCPPACPPSPTNCDANLVISQTQGLHFGSFSVTTGGGGGTIVIDPTGLRSTPSPGITLISTDAGNAATFSMTTTPYNCNGRALATVSAVSASGLTGPGTSMALDTFVMIPAAGGAFDSAVPLQLGATLHVADGQTPGNYSGVYTLTVTFQ